VLIAGGIGLGLVLGWAAARLIYRAPWHVRVWVLLGLVAQGLTVLALASAVAAIGFGVALALSGLACATWVRSLEARYGRVE
jgi:F0F1-type ATP synthase assembly protein I